MIIVKCVHVSNDNRQYVDVTNDLLPQCYESRHTSVKHVCFNISNASLIKSKLFAIREHNTFINVVTKVNIENIIYYG